MPGKRGAPERSRSSRLSRSSCLTVRNSWPEARNSPTVRGRSEGAVGVIAVGASVTARTLLRLCDNQRPPIGAHGGRHYDGCSMNATMIARDLAAGHGDRTLFAGLDLVVAPGDVIGLVGVNGAGKTTLLRTLAGLLPVESGTVALSPPTANVGYLPQERDRRAGETVREFLARRTGVGPAQARMDAAAADLP